VAAETSSEKMKKNVTLLYQIEREREVNFINFRHRVLTFQLQLMVQLCSNTSDGDNEQLKGSETTELFN
jgi:hypothetical protein